MNDVISIANKINEKILLLEKTHQEILKRGDEKSQAITNYEKSLAVCIIKLKNGITMELEGQVIQNPQATFLEKIARGLCFKEKLEMETCEAKYKSLIIGIETVMAELNALQSLNKHLDKIF